MKNRVKRLCWFLVLALARELAKSYRYENAIAPDFVLDEVKREPNIPLALITCFVVWGLCELLFWGIAKIRKKK